MRSGTPSCDREKTGRGKRDQDSIPENPAPTGKENQGVSHKNAGAVTPMDILMDYAGIPVHVIDFTNACCGCLVFASDNSNSYLTLARFVMFPRTLLGFSREGGALLAKQG